MPAANLGYAIASARFTPAECERISQALDHLPRSRAGARHLLSQPAVGELAHDQRLLELAAEWLGGPAVPFRATLFEKSRETNWLIRWHQDTALPLSSRFDAPGWGPWSEKAGILYAHAPAWALSRVIALRVHLDRSDARNGPLRVIPGSHLDGVLGDTEVLRRAGASPPAVCLTERGGILAMRPLLIHASSKALGDEPRRVLHIEYAGSLDFDGGIRLAVV